MSKKLKNELLGAESSALSPKEIAEAYFDAHPDLQHDSLYVADDGVVFFGDAKGFNCAQNYCKDKGISFEQVNK